MPGWTDKQRIMLLRASNLAGWTPQQRYMAMRHAGCPNAAGKSRPSVSHPRNHQAAFERVMALAEAQAATLGNCVPGPSTGASWQHAAERARASLEAKAAAIAHEAQQRCSEQFGHELLTATIRHVTQHDDASLPIHAEPRDLVECDEGQLHRVIESLKAHVGRVFAERGIRPRTFDVPPSAARRASGTRTTTSPTTRPTTKATHNANTTAA